MSKRRCFLLALVGAGLLAVVTWVNSRSYQLWQWEAREFISPEELPPSLGGTTPEDAARRFFLAYVNQPMMALAYLAPADVCKAELQHVHEALPFFVWGAMLYSNKLVTRALPASERAADQPGVQVELEYTFRADGKTLTIEAAVHAIPQDDGYWYICAPDEREAILARARTEYEDRP